MLSWSFGESFSTIVNLYCLLQVCAPVKIWECTLDCAHLCSAQVCHSYILTLICPVSLTLSLPQVLHSSSHVIMPLGVEEVKSLV